MAFERMEGLGTAEIVFPVAISAIISGVVFAVSVNRGPSTRISTWVPVLIVPAIGFAFPFIVIPFQVLMEWQDSKRLADMLELAVVMVAVFAVLGSPAAFFTYRVLHWIHHLLFSKKPQSDN